MKTFIAISLAATFNVALVLGIPSLQGRATSWVPKVGDTWNYLLGDGNITVAQATASKAKVVDIDLFLNSAATIAGIKAQNVKVICYFSAGTYEPNRPDSAQIKSAEKGTALPDYPDEFWLDIRTPNINSIMAARIQLAFDRGCDAVEPDNIDGYTNANGLSLTYQNSVDFMNGLITKAASLNLAIGLKNSNELISTFVSKVQFAVNEQCLEYYECDDWNPFIAASKPVFHVEYPPYTDSERPASEKIPTDIVPKIPSKNIPLYCTGSAFSTVLKQTTLFDETQYCPDGSQVVTTATTG